MNIKDIIRKQDNKYNKKNKPIKHAPVGGFTREEWYIRKQAEKKKNSQPDIYLVAI